MQNDIYPVCIKSTKVRKIFKNEIDAILFNLENLETTKLDFKPNDASVLDAIKNFYNKPENTSDNINHQEVKSPCYQVPFEGSVDKITPEILDKIVKNSSYVDLNTWKLGYYGVPSDPKDSTPKTTKVEKTKPESFVVLTDYYANGTYQNEVFNTEDSALKHYFDHKPYSCLAFIPSNLREEDLFHCGDLVSDNKKFRCYKVVNHRLKDCLSKTKPASNETSTTNTNCNVVVMSWDDFVKSPHKGVFTVKPDGNVEIALDHNSSLNCKIQTEKSTSINSSDKVDNSMKKAITPKYVCNFESKKIHALRKLDYFFSELFNSDAPKINCDFCLADHKQPIFEIFDDFYQDNILEKFDVYLLKHISIYSKHNLTKKTLLYLKIDLDSFSFYVTMSFINSNSVKYFIDSSYKMLQSYFDFHNDFQDLYSLLSSSLYDTGNDFSLIQLEI